MFDVGGLIRFPEDDLCFVITEIEFGKYGIKNVVLSRVIIDEENDL